MRDTAIPSFVLKRTTPFNLLASRTDAQLSDQGYTFNQAGITFNDAGVTFGGIYNRAEDILSMVFSAQVVQPMNVFFSDIYHLPPVPNNQKVVGPGWFLYVGQ